MDRILVFLVAIFSLGHISAQDYFQPEQLHLSYPDDPSQMVVTWSTFNITTSSVCEYGEGGLNTIAEGNCTKFTDDGSERRVQYIHRVTLKDLIPGSLYVYHCGSDEGWSQLFFFTAIGSGSDWSPTLAVYGDMGSVNAQSLPYLQEEVQRGLYDAIIHVGDMAYDLDSDNGRNGDEFMRQIETIAAYVPYMAGVGNHESLYNFSHYKNRFTMPGNGSENLFFTFNIGPAHFISLSAEFYHYLEYGFQQLPNQYRFLERDLQEANRPENRKLRPWIIVFSHRALYCSTYSGYGECDQEKNRVKVGLPPKKMYGIENLFYLYGVDLYFGAHEHYYERMFPVFNGTVMNGSAGDPYTDPRATVHVTTGSAGCESGLDPFLMNHDWTAFRSTDYGYTRVQVCNSSHLQLQQISTTRAGEIVDSVWIRKGKHGPYPQLFPEESVYN